MATSAFGVVGSDSFLDATGVDWGDPSGPSPIGTGVGYTGGGVLVAGWKGWVQQSPRYSDSYIEPVEHVCRNIVFIGARGSEEGTQTDLDPAFENPVEGLDSSQYAGAIGSRVADVLDGFQAELAHGYPQSVKVWGVPYRALGVLSSPFRMLYDADYFSSIYDGVTKTVEMVEDERTKCPSQKIVLSGYSQGALVIHIALRQLARSDPGAFDSIAGVALISDPGKTANGAEKLLEAYDPDFFNDWAGNGVTKAEGIWTKFTYGDDVGPLPSLVTGKTISMCRNHDPVCAPPSPQWLVERLVLSTSLHTDSYYQTHTDVLGRWVADQYRGYEFQLNP